MNGLKHFPFDFSDEEIKTILSDLINRNETDFLTEGQEINIERKIMVCQNQLLLSSLIKSNEKLSQQQATLVQQQEILINQQNSLAKLFTENEKANKRTAKEAKLIILLTILTLLVTSALDWYHMSEENENQLKMIEQLDTLLLKTNTHLENEINHFSNPKTDSSTRNFKPNKIKNDNRK